MSSTAATAEKKPNPTARKPRRISREEFLREYSDMEDGYKYEWNDGIVEKTKSMNQEQSRIFFLLNKFFAKTAASKKGGGLISETDMWTSKNQLRRPDILFFTGDQIEKLGKENQIAPWLAEIISENDKADKINEKLEEYFRAGVQVVWHIYPASKQVYVYTSVEDVTICRGKTVCSGAPAVPDFEVTAEELFA